MSRQGRRAFQAEPSHLFRPGPSRPPRLGPLPLAWLEEHGGDRVAAARRWGVPPGGLLDLSASINPFGPPPGVLRSAARTLRRRAQNAVGPLADVGPLFPGDREGGPSGRHVTALEYPQRDGTPLRQALAARLGVPTESLLLTNGGAEAIHLLVRGAVPRRLVVPVPSFGEYARAAASLGIPVVTLPLAAERGFAVATAEVEGLAALLRPGDLLFLANPNNPTGRLVAPGVLASLMELAGERRALLAVDEAFLPLAADGAASLAGWAAQGAPVAVAGSLTKVYALPGLRLGYLVATPALVAAAGRQQPPWAVNSVALAAGLACLEADADGSFTRHARERLAAEREWLRRRLARVCHVAVYPSDANFLLLRVASLPLAAAAGGAAPAVIEEAPRAEGPGGAYGPAAALAAQGILVRDCSSFPGLGPSFIRVAVGRRAANRRLAGALSASVGFLWRDPGQSAEGLPL